MAELEVLHDRYGRGLFDYALESEAVDEIEDNLQALTDLIHQHTSLREVLDHPGIDRQEKISVLGDIAKRAKFCDEFLDFLKVLIENNRFSLVHGIFLRYKDLYEQMRKRTKVLVKSARPLSETQLNHLSRALKKRLEEDVAVEQEVEPSLISGLCLKFHDRVYDDSLLAQLNDLRNSLSLRGAEGDEAI